jgi:hypothetical protein
MIRMCQAEVIPYVDASLDPPRSAPRPLYVRDAVATFVDSAMDLDWVRPISKGGRSSLGCAARFGLHREARPDHNVRQPSLRSPGPPSPLTTIVKSRADETLELGRAQRDAVLVGDQQPRRRASASGPPDLPGCPELAQPREHPAVSARPDLGQCTAPRRRSGPIRTSAHRRRDVPDRSPSERRTPSRGRGPAHPPA